MNNINITESEAFSRMSAYCASAEHCRAEVTEKLQRWGMDYAVVARVVERLVKENYINEERYCRAFIRDKFRFDKWGKRKIAQALRMKKISPLVYSPLLAEVDSEEYLAILQALLDSKKKSVHAGTENELYGKLVRFALSRGFDMDDIRRCIDLCGINEWTE